jgi:hypothetical protein
MGEKGLHAPSDKKAHPILADLTSNTFTSRAPPPSCKCNFCAFKKWLEFLRTFFLTSLLTPLIRAGLCSFAASARVSSKKQNMRSLFYIKKSKKILAMSPLEC